ncbi:MAG: hypothetical protein LBG96_16785 [Tannerella sp.]|jgi:hypothetical protein|nr:hypothetical protein [Tannerella sp.]
MAEGTIYTAGMQYVSNPSKTARFAIDQGSSKPDCMSLQDLLKMNDSFIRLINQTRKCFNLDVVNKRLVLSDWVILAVGSGSGKAFYSIPSQTVNWVKGDVVLSYQGYFFIVADAAATPAIHVISQDVPWPAMVNPVIVGVFYCSGERIEGLSIFNDDVTVDGEYIYTAPPAATDVLFAGSTRGCMNINSANKTLVLNSDAKIIVKKSNSLVPASWSLESGNTSWYKGNALEYDGTYIVYADIVEADQSSNRVVAVRRGASYVPAGDLYIIGTFDYSGTAVTGINFKNDVYVNGSYIYGGGGGGLADAPSDGKTYGRKNAAWSEITSSGGSDGATEITPKFWLVSGFGVINIHTDSGVPSTGSYINIIGGRLMLSNGELLILNPQQVSFDNSNTDTYYLYMNDYTAGINSRQYTVWGTSSLDDPPSGDNVVLLGAFYLYEKNVVAYSFFGNRIFINSTLR